ncbi:MAG: ROK family transcriptional regulator [Microbacterium gubbeenense]|uniref:ROK family transcriptional regulator n=2 Tax=Microbacterium gubbeenense TaxID=159896 RepID=UPI00040C5642|nr:ROK family transcriptional regulator [Microbacterium gubbeenense]
MGSGANVEGVRRANLGEILRLVHHRGPLSRAALTQETGLNRSTIGGLVTTLAENGLVSEENPDPTRRVGRPSPTVVATEGILAVAVNPEVDALEIGAVGFGGVVRARTRQETDLVLAPEEVAARVAAVVDEWRSGELRDARLLGVGVAVPGLVRASDGIVRNAPHLGWRDVDIASLISERTGLSAAVGNDASLGAVAEWLFGAAQNHDDVIYLNGGPSGIGGGVILGGRSLAGAGGYAGEWGQNRPSLDDEADRRVPGGVLEDEVNRARLFDALGVRDDEALAAALRSATADEVARQRRILAATLANAANALDPSTVVLGGFLAALRGADPTGFDDAVRAQMLEAPAEGMTVAAAALGADRLLTGAAELVFEQLMADPIG